MIRILNYTTLFCILLVLVGMFLPAYETWIGGTDLHDYQGFGISRVYQKGNETIAVHNGFGSFYAIFSCFLTLLWAIGIFVIPKDLAIPVLGVVLGVFGLIVLNISLVFSDVRGSLPDEMLFGFYLILIAEIILSFISFYKMSRLREDDKYMR